MKKDIDALFPELSTRTPLKWKDFNIEPLKVIKTTYGNKKLNTLREKMLQKDLPENLTNMIKRIGKDSYRPLGGINPWAWWVELTRGCNLRCDFCPTRLFPKGKLDFMDKDTWIALLGLIQEVSPYTRLELCNAGEPTLHPNILEYLKIARDICPNIQILTYTNGTQLVNKKLTYKKLFEAGLNMVFVDMYAPFATHKKLAEESGYYWYYQDDKPKDAPSIFTYQNNPDAHIIMLAENPYNWSTRKLGRGYLQTFFNDLDWPAAKKFGMKPVTEAPKRRCDLPNKFINVNYDGTYIFCCFDYLRHSIDNFGNVSNGLKDFFDFWLGKYMQDTRIKMHNKDRASHEYCSKCRFTSIRCDIPYWKPELSKLYWNGKKWSKVND